MISPQNLAIEVSRADLKNPETLLHYVSQITAVLCRQRVEIDELKAELKALQGKKSKTIINHYYCSRTDWNP